MFLEIKNQRFLLAIGILVLMVIIHTYFRRRWNIEKLEMGDVEVKNPDGSCNTNQTLMNLLTQYNLLDQQLEKQDEAIKDLDTQIKAMKTTITSNTSEIAQINAGLQQFASEATSEPTGTN